MSDELNNLALEAGSIDNAAASEQFEQAQEQKISLNASYKPIIENFLNTAAGFVGKRIYFAPQIFTPDANENIAENIVNVVDAEGWNLKELIGDPDSRLGAWAALAISVGMPSFMFYLAWQETKAQQQAAPVEKPVQDAPVEQPTGFHA